MTYTPRNLPNNSTGVDPQVDGNVEADFGDKMRVTDGIMLRINRNLSYLKSNQVTLQDSTDPELRKRFTPPQICNDASYGFYLDTGTNTYKMDGSTTKEIVDDFTDLTNIDIVNTNCYVDHITNNGQISLPQSWTVSEACDQDSICSDGGHLYPKGLNTYWYFGWQKGKAFWMSPKWVQDPFSQAALVGAPEPSVCRAMTFKANVTGQLTKVQLWLYGTHTAEDYAYVEIRTTSGGAPTQTVVARTQVGNLKTTKGAIVAVPFSHPPQLVAGTTYAIVVRGGFTSYGNYGIGGWQVKCPGTKYANGNPYVSLDNGRTWTLHSSFSDISFKEGNVRPREFAFQTYMLTGTLTYPTSGTYRVYFKPIRCNPIQQIKCTPQQTTTNGAIVWEVSSDMVNWHTITGPSWLYDFTTGPAGEKNKNTAYIRATLSTTLASTSPSIQSVDIVITTVPATQGYLRTLFYNPRTANPMGAAIWSRVHAPANIDPTCTCLVDIIRNVTSEELIPVTGAQTTVTLADYPAYPMKDVFANGAGTTTPVPLTENKDFTVNYDTKVITFTAAPAAGTVLAKYNPIWIKGLDQTNFPQATPSGFKTDLFDEFFNGTGAQTVFTLKAVPADPIRHVYVNTVEYYEDTDFVVDYFNKTITFNTAPSAGTGNVEVKYTPYLADIGLAFAYRTTRPTPTGNLPNITVLGNYFQNRV